MTHRMAAERSISPEKCLPPDSRLFGSSFLFSFQESHLSTRFALVLVAACR